MKGETEGATLRYTCFMSKPKVGEIYALQLHDGRWGACQVIWAEETQVELLALDWIGASPPKLEALKDVGALMLESEPEPAPCRINVSPVYPWRVKRVGEARLIASFEDRCTAWSGWGYIAHQVLAQWRWVHEVPEEVKKARSRLQERRGESVSLEIGGISRVMDASTWRLWIGPQDIPGMSHHLRFSADEPVPWHRFEPLQLVNEVQYEGTDPGFVSFLESRPFVARVLWRGHGQREIDLSNTWVRTFTLEVGDEPVDVTVSERLEALHLTGKVSPERVSVTDRRDGWGIRLSITSSQLPERLEGLAALREISVFGLSRADTERLLGYPALQSVTLQGAPGELDDIEKLLHLEDLRELAIQDFYEMDVRELPSFSEWPALDTLTVRGVREEDADVLEEKMQGVRRLSIRGKRDTVWVRAHVDNPFKGWVVDNFNLGRFACAAFREASRAMQQLGGEAKVEAVLSALESFVSAFNRIHEEQPLDGARSELVVATIDELIGLTGVEIEPRRLQTWLDERRDF